MLDLETAAAHHGNMISIDLEKVSEFAAFFRTSAEVLPFDFCHTGELPIYPPAGAAGLIDFFFFNAGHQFGFWRLEEERYAGPMIAAVDGRALKGSDYVSYCLTRAWRAQSDIFAPHNIAHADWNRVFSADDGTNPLPQWADHVAIIRRYAEWFAQHNTTPTALVQRANQSTTPLATFLAEAGRVPGYVEDPLRKKLFLLAIMLENRPEHFLRVTDPQAYEPIIDYHLQRSTLRCGLVRVQGDALRNTLVERRLVPSAVEEEIRRATFDAVRDLVRESGQSVAAIDYFFFMNRRRCPEMSTPDCPHCPVQEICAREIALFQPVFRTTAY